MAAIAQPGLPSESEIAARTQDGLGLTRPEIAALLAYSKNVVRQELLSSDIPDDPAFVSALSAYFPDSWQCGLLTDGITEHRLTELPRHIDGCQPIAPERISRLKEVVARSRRDGFVDVPRAAAISAELSSLCRRAGGAGG